MKRFASIILVVLLLLTALSGCHQGDKADKVQDKKISIVCTIFPPYDWVRQILGDQADDMDLTLLLNNRVDLHSYQPSVEDIVKISTCDLFIYVGGESDQWVETMLKEPSNTSRVVINFLDTLGNTAKTEEPLEGMQEEEHEDEAKDEAKKETEYDEHVWLSLKNAKTFCSVIAGALSSLDPDHAGEYKNNADAYTMKLSDLDAEYNTVIEASPVKTLLFGDRFPFRYLTDDYGLTPYAAFPGCSAETEASFDTVIGLAKKVDELNLNTIMVTESSDQSIARTILNSTQNKNQQILVLNSMQSVTLGDVRNGTTYHTIMESNLNVLKEALK
ncbi:MAG: metal ABC transporter substrate-binding protein [Peptococcaceae bacterium]|nr:metal ABC transporter substrate-binding protein [Peptococcaceae bacterium]